MTNEQAIDRLRKISEKTPIRTNGDDLVAITMAIRAMLENEELSKDLDEALKEIDGYERGLSQEPYICDTCKHKGAGWDTEPCDGCCGNHSGYEPCMGEICTDNRFEIIEKAKKHLLEATNIETSEDEMKVIDNFLFRCWQMGWLDKYEMREEQEPCEKNHEEKPHSLLDAYFQMRKESE